MKERQVEGIKRAKAEGKYKGRVPTAMRQADKVKALVEAGVQRVQVRRLHVHPNPRDVRWLDLTREPARRLQYV